MKNIFFIIEFIIKLFAVIVGCYIIFKYTFFGEQPDNFMVFIAIILYMQGFLKHSR